MPKQKKNKQKPPPAEIENAPPNEQHKMLVEMLKVVQSHMDQQNSARSEIDAFHKRCGKNQAPDMNKKERSEASTIYNRNLNQLEGGNAMIRELITNMKMWRTNAINKAKETGELNAIEVMKLKHGCLPILDPKENKEPYGAGAIPWPDDKRPEKGDEVAAFVDESKTWILAEVIGSVSNHRYECVDVDDQDRKIAVFARKQLILLPKFTVDYSKYPHMALPKNAIVLAVFPGTTCFYEGYVHEPPIVVSGSYHIRFIDNQQPNKYSDPLEVSERYVIAFRKDPKMYIRPEKRAELGIEQPKEPLTKNQKKKQRKLKKKQSNEEEIVIEDKDVPGPAPKPQEPVYYESTDEELKDKKPKQRKKPGERKKKEPKVKIIRARVPAHKKRISTRQFGKRRVKRKPKNAVPVSANQDEPSTSEQKQDGNEPVGVATEEKHVNEPAEDAFVDAEPELTGVSRYGLEEEREETDSEEDNKVDDKGPEEKRQEKEEEDVQKEPHDPEEGTSSGPRRVESESDSDSDYGRRRSSSIDSSDVQSGISISDNERKQRGYETEDEAED